MCYQRDQFGSHGLLYHISSLSMVGSGGATTLGDHALIFEDTGNCLVITCERVYNYNN